MALALCLILSACHDDESNAGLKTIHMSYGRYHYSVLYFDKRDQVVKVVQGLRNNETDSGESTYKVMYSGSRIMRIISTTESRQYTYKYDGDRITESREYVEGKLATTHSFVYDGEGRVEVWLTKKTEGLVTIPFQRRFYTYDASGNATSIEWENYDPATRGYQHLSTARFLEFDDKKNTMSLFLNFDNPTHVDFVNNPAVRRIENANGSVGETTYTYEYNADGYTTLQRDLVGGLDILYTFNPSN